MHDVCSLAETAYNLSENALVQATIKAKSGPGKSV